MGEVVSMAAYREKLFVGEIFLAIEDDHTDLKLLKHIVESRGGTFFSATNLEEAEAILRHINVSILTVDLNLGAPINGLCVLSTLRIKIGREFTPRKIMIISGSIQEECEIGLVKALPKPIVPEKLIKYVKVKRRYESA